MYKIIAYLKDFIKEHNSVKFWIAWFVFNAICIGINYGYRFKDKYIDAQNFPFVEKVFVFTIFYGVAWFTPFLLYKIFAPNPPKLPTKQFWWISFFALFLLAVYINSASLYSFLVTEKIDYHLQYFILKCCNSVIRPLFVVPLMLVYWYFFDRKHTNSFYGFSTQNFDWKPYAIMLGIMIPLIFSASFLPDFLKQYPRYLPNRPDYNQAEIILNWPKTYTIAVYEFCYGISFVFIELFFRGFLIFCLLRYTGSSVIFAATSLYIFIHFDKPLGETIGSMFGGLILGVIASRTQNIWGGIAIHLGVAWLMELFALLQHYHYL
ncbi:CAAX protease self-immunity [Flexibacter flexilis DSM 6793]|uniref:CAAX protease self-immunity n=1 Tax=Flexibacter flexilis DSM 6793 TaxID=927664 RepID=A0A1I1E916_9BACT|nr:CPBP family intramembrane glutamic endopeptidase [Flexibacter flexilis]SFB83092.1 CAAX protease self-immunity [Flexibacter flexilis DSM 6793]